MFVRTMSRFVASAGGGLGMAFVILATSCTNDFDQLFDGGAGSPSKEDGGGATCNATCGLGGKSTDLGYTFLCSACACSCKVPCPENGKDCSGTCAAGTTCDVACTGTGRCSLVCEPGAGCLLHCGKGACDLTCTGGKRTECSDGTIACNTACPK